MRDEEQAGPVEFGAEVAVVERGDDGLAGSGGGGDEVVGVALAALDLEPFEDLALERVRLDLERREDRVVGFGGCGGPSEALGVEGLEVRVGPVRGEGAVEGRDEFGVEALRCSDVPLEAGDLCREGEVG